MASYIPPLERAWLRTRTILMQPFDIEKWLVIGFAAFVSGLAGGWTNVSFSFNPPGWKLGYPNGALDAFSDPFEHAWRTDFSPVGLLIGAPLILIAIAIGVTVLWLSSRMSFVFLDDMLRGRGAIVEPWNRYGRLGNSLFLWRLGFMLALFVLFGMIVSPLILVARGGSNLDLNAVGWLAALMASVVSLVVGVLAGYTALFLESFVVPLMYKRDCGTMDAWRLFVPLLRTNPLEFLLYGIIILIGCIAVGVALLVSAFVTCCFVPLILAIPYVGSVVLLPLHGLYRLYGVEFLSQFGPDFTVAAAQTVVEPEVVPPGSAPPAPPAPEPDPPPSS